MRKLSLAFVILPFPGRSPNWCAVVAAMCSSQRGSFQRGTTAAPAAFGWMSWLSQLSYLLWMKELNSFSVAISPSCRVWTSGTRPCPFPGVGFGRSSPGLLRAAATRFSPSVCRRGLLCTVSPGFWWVAQTGVGFTCLLRHRWSCRLWLLVWETGYVTSRAWYSFLLRRSAHPFTYCCLKEAGGTVHVAPQWRWPLSRW